MDEAPPETPPVHSPRARLWIRWFLATVIGAAFGHALTSLLSAVAGQSVAVPGSRVEQAVLAFVLVVVGTVEGAAVGTAQWFALRFQFPRLAPATWIFVTAFASGFGWLLASFSTELGKADLGRGEPVSVAAFAGMLSGLMMGLGQARLLRAAGARPLPWVSANAGAWAIALAGSTLLRAHFNVIAQPVLAERLLAAVRGALAGAVVGAITGLVLVLFSAPRPLAPPRVPSL